MDSRDVHIGETGGLEPRDALGVRLARAERTDVAAGRPKRQRQGFVVDLFDVRQRNDRRKRIGGELCKAVVRPSGNDLRRSKRVGLANAVLGSMTLTSYPEAVAIIARCCAMCVAPTIMIAARA